MSITTINPFQLLDMSIGDENSDPDQYRFGKMAAMIAKLWREQYQRTATTKGCRSWGSDLELAEEGLVEYASDMMGERVKLHDNYI